MFNVVIMAGGKGTRLGGLKKPFINICGKRLIDVAISVAKQIIGREKVYVCLNKEDTSILGPIPEGDVNIVVCPGAGYVNDLNYVLRIVELPVLVLPADMPFLSQKIVVEFLDKAQATVADVVTLVACRNSVCRETGISFFRKAQGDWFNVYFNDCLELKDIDTYEDLAEVQRLCASMEEIKKQE